jgi:cystinosin
MLSQVWQVWVVSRSFSTIRVLGYFKVAISFCKYLPQFWWNCSRRSTVGWSIFNVLLDFTGGLFSLLQLILEAVFDDRTGINPVKLLLSAIGIIYDILFLLQHYVLYPERNSQEDDRGWLSFAGEMETEERIQRMQERSPLRRKQADEFEDS